MTSPKQEGPPSSPPIFRPWQLDLPSTAAHSARYYNPLENGVFNPLGNGVLNPLENGVLNPLENGFLNPLENRVHSQLEDGVHNPLPKETKDKVNGGPSTPKDTRRLVRDSSSSSSSAKLKRPLEDGESSAVSKFLRAEEVNDEEVGIKNHTEIPKYSSKGSSGTCGASEALRDLYPQYLNSSGPGRLPLMPTGFGAFPSSLTGFQFLPAIDRLPPLGGALMSGCPTPGALPPLNGALLATHPGPSMLPSLESFSGPMVPLMDVLVPAAEVERVCAKRPRPKRFGCSECGSAFSNKGQLKGHLRIHTGERPFACGHQGCGKRFTRNEELTRHRRIHSGARPFPCPLCDKRFGRKDHLKKHTRTHQRQTTIVGPSPVMPPTSFKQQVHFHHHMQQLQALQAFHL